MALPAKFEPISDPEFVVTVPTRSARTLSIVRGVVQVLCALEGALHEAVGRAVSSAIAQQSAPLPQSPVGDEAAYLSTRVAATLAGVHPATVRDWMRRGLLHEHRAGRELRVRRDELCAFLARGASAPTRVDVDLRAEQILEKHRRRG